MLLNGSVWLPKNWLKLIRLKIVTAAEAEAEKRPPSRGRYCRATEGYCRWFGRFYQGGLKDTNVNLTEEQIMSILLTNQYLDTLNNFAEKQGTNTLFFQQIRMA